MLKNLLLLINTITIPVMLLSSLSAEAATLFCDRSDSSSMFAAREISAALALQGNGTTAIRDLSGLTAGSEDIRIVLSKKGVSNVSTALASEGGSSVGTLKSEGYAIRVTTSGARTTYWVIGSDAIGTMYGGLEIAQRIPINELGSLTNSEHEPYIEFRGLKYDCPLDIRTPAYGDAGDAAQNNIINMWSMDFWKEFLDELARDRINRVHLWTQNPFPVLVKVPEYPNVSLDDVQRATIPFQHDKGGTGMDLPEVLNSAKTILKMTIDEKIKHWQKVMEYGRDRGVFFALSTFNIHLYSMEGKYGITWSMTNPTTNDYFRKATEQLFLSYPLLKGMGAYPGEAMDGMPYNDRVQWIYDTYGQGILDVKKQFPNREIEFYFRATNAIKTNTGESVFSDYPDTLDISVRYSRARMYSSLTPTAADEVLGAISAPNRAILELRNEDYYVMRFGDPNFMRGYIQNMPPRNKLHGFVYGSNGFQYGREYTSTDPDTPRQLLVKKMWYTYFLLGRLSYDPSIPNSYFEKIVAHRFPEVNSTAINKAWNTVSMITPILSRFMYQGILNDNHWWSEACYSSTFNPNAYDGFVTIDDFINEMAPFHDKMLSIPEYVTRRDNGQVMGGDTTPLQVAQLMKEYAATALEETATMNPGTNKELRLTIGDIVAQSHLGNYYAEKIIGATYKALYEKNNTKFAAYKDSAIAHLQVAATHWRKYATVYGSFNIPQVMSRLGKVLVDNKVHMANVLDDIALAGGSDEAMSVQPTPGGIILEAEEAQIKGGGNLESANNGFTGKGYVKLSSDNVTINWTYTAPQPGLYSIEFRYAIDNGDVPVTLNINGSGVTPNLSFWTTANTWQTETRKVIFQAGANTISIEGLDQGAMVDHVNISHLATD